MAPPARRVRAGMTSMLRPKALRTGDVSRLRRRPAGWRRGSPAARTRRRNARRDGVRRRVSPLVDLTEVGGGRPAPPAEVAEDLNRHLRDPDVRALVSLTGGRMTLSYLDLIDVEAVRADPKPVLGMSDISALHLGLHARTGLVSLHSDLVTFGFGEWDEVDDARRRPAGRLYRRVLTEDTPLGPLPAGSRWESWRSGPRGRSADRRDAQPPGACAGDFVCPSPERFDGAILFWEESSHRPRWSGTTCTCCDGGGAGPDLRHGRGRPFEVEPTPPGPTRSATSSSRSWAIVTSL